MATAQEIEKLVVTLTAQANQYEKVLSDAESRIAGTAKIIEAEAREAARVTEAMLTPSERYTAEVDRLDKMLRKGQISQETYNRALAQAKQTLPSVIAEQERLSRAAEENAKAIDHAKRVTTAVETETERYAKEVKALDKLLKQGHISQTTYNRAKKELRNLLPAVRAAQEAENKAIEDAKRVTEQTMTATEKYEREVQKLSKLLKAGKISQETYNRAVAQAKRELPAVQAAQRRHNEQLARAKTITAAAETATEKYAREVKELKQLHAAGMISTKTYHASMKKLSAGMTKLPGQLQAVSGALNSVSSGITSAGRRMTMFVTGPLAAFAAFSVKAFADYDKAMVESTAIMGDLTDTQRAKMEELAISLSDKGVQSARELAESYYFLASAGLDAEASLAALPAVQKFATAGAFDMKLATDLLTDAQSALGKSYKDPIKNQREMIKLSDQLVTAATLANTSVQQVSESLTNDAATASRQFGMETSTVLAILDKYGDKGKKGAEAGNLLGRATRLLAGAFQENGAAFQKYGIDVVDKATGEYRDFIDIIADMEEGFKNLTGPQRSAALAELGFAALAQKSITPLLGSAAAMREYKEAIDAGGGKTEEVYAKQMESFSNQLMILKNQFTNLAIEIGQILAPWILWLNEKLQAGIAWFRSLSDTTKKWIVGIGAAVAALGPLLIVLGTIVGVVASVVAGIAFFVTLGWEVVLIAAAIAAGVAVAVVELTALAGALAGVVYWLVGADGIESAWNNIMAAAQNAIMTIIGFVANLSHNLKVFLDWFPRNWMNVAKDLITIWITFSANMISNALTALKTLFRLWTAMQGWLSGIFKQIFTVDFLKAIWEGIKMAGKAFLNFASAAWKAIKSIFTGKKTVTMEDFIGQMESDFEGGSTDFLGTAKGILQDGLGDLKAPLDGFKSSIEETPKFVYDISKKTGEAVGEGLTEGAQTAGETAAQATKAVVDQVSEEMLKLADDVEKLEEKYTKSIAMFGKSGREAEIYALKMRGASDAQLKAVKAADAHLTKLEKQKKLMDKGKQITEAMKTPLEKFADRQNELQELLKAGAIDAETFQRAMAKANEEIAGDKKVHFQVTGIQGVEAGTAEAAARLAEYRALRPDKVNVPDPGAVARKPQAVAIAPRDAQQIKAQVEHNMRQKEDGRDEKWDAALNFLSRIADNTANFADQEFAVLEPAEI